MQAWRLVLLAMLLLSPGAAPVGLGQDLGPEQGPARGRGAAPAPDLDFDYRGYIAEHMRQISKGLIDQALEHVQSRMKNPGGLVAKREEIRRNLSALYGASGRFEGHEIMSYRRLSSRCYKFYVFAKYEDRTVMFSYLFLFEKSRNKWLVGGFAFTDNLDSVESYAPLQPLDEPWQSPHDPDANQT